MCTFSIIYNQYSLRSAHKQEIVEEVIIRFTKEYKTRDYSFRSLYNGFQDTFKLNRGQTIETVIIITKDNKIIHLNTKDIRDYFENNDIKEAFRLKREREKK